ncbi:45 kDa calcium-binding protein [Hetaerina americana]|uniref:45 kDa calcium-binding protein n=1 Tax=Hetaerina americana TaxID=62018 RepID=UPI003A7F25FD
MKSPSSVLCLYKESKCKRGAVLAAAAPFLIYLCFFTLVRNFSLPLRSDGLGKVTSARKENEEDKNGIEPDTRAEGEGDGFISQGMQTEEEGEEKDPKITLEDVFLRADTDGDGLLSVAELTSWIGGKIKDHLDHALKENFGLFAAIDNNPRNGVITWDEYHRYFLKGKGLSKDYAQKHDKRHKGLSRAIKEAIARDRASWSEAAHSDPDSLTLDEFLAFRHPESSHATILALVDEMLEKFDRDGDGQLTETEYSRFIWDEGEADEEVVEDHQRREGEVQREEERRKEFREQVDADKNGHADRRELLKFIDPSNPRHAREEAETLMVLSDADHDGHLSLREVLNKMDLFLGSKMVDAARSFHDEF